MIQESSLPNSKNTSPIDLATITPASQNFAQSPTKEISEDYTTSSNFQLEISPVQVDAIRLQRQRHFPSKYAGFEVSIPPSLTSKDAIINPHAKTCRSATSESHGSPSRTRPNCTATPSFISI
ncbi:hypothetical protein CCACVL1_09036 [Corchorus capsularis]|uniref:Uncharacterized protein n=1 Tax=Corchorus capsularis TaxID=210143 RepID=A0A1R3IY23_COCAP|nr:hypothetical protein CCACVL1_09036 [Corchorus capsularis]